MERHGVVAAAPGVSEPLHPAQPHHAPTAAHEIARHDATLALLADFTGFAGAVRVDDPVQAEDLLRQLIRRDRRRRG